MRLIHSTTALTLLFAALTAAHIIYDGKLGPAHIISAYDFWGSERLRQSVRQSRHRDIAADPYNLLSCLRDGKATAEYHRICTLDLQHIYRHTQAEGKGLQLQYPPS